MRRGAIAGVCLLGTALLTPAIGATSASATAPEIVVSGDGVGMYPAFDPAITRYAVTTTGQTGGAVTVTAPAGSTVDGVPATGAVHLTGLAEGDEIAVGVGGTSYALVYLPADFPALTVTTHQAGLAPGYIGLGLTTFGPGTLFDTLIDRNGVPIWFHRDVGNDLKRQPNGDLTTFRPTAAPGHTGVDLVTLDEQFQEAGRQRMTDGLTNTDNHDAEKLTDGSTILIGYEPRGDCATGYLDATIQKTDAAGVVSFEWNSKDHMVPLVESLNPLPWPINAPCQRTDYAHINSVEEISDGTHDLLVSFRHLSAVYRIATRAHDGFAAGDVVWRLGGRHSSFDFVGDPDNGPCAQHTASMLTNGDVLVFDNGSVAFGDSRAGCVDPTDTTGPGIARAHTRIAEWALDTTTHTATLVWSYQATVSDPDPRPAFAFFAGSARRLGNGDTLIGWADERAMLASEVKDDGTVLWQVQTPPTDTPHQTRYATYRASLVPYSDAIDPEIDLDLPDSQTYVAGATPAPHWSCTDRGGSNLASCTTSGLEGGRLAATPGAHTFAVTATDGAGNSRTVVRSYRVVAADGLIRKDSGDRWRGSNVYGPATDQTIRQRVGRRHQATARWRIQNDGATPSAFDLAGAASTDRFHVRYFVGGADVTHAIVTGRFRTPILAPGAWTSVRVEVTPTRRAPVGATRTVRLHASSSGGAAVDTVATRVTARR